MTGVARIVVVIGALAASSDPASRVTGGISTYQVTAGDTLVSIGARAGVEARTLARDNGLSATDRLHPGDRLAVDNRHIAPEGYRDGIVLNVPQRMLFVFDNGELVRAFPVAVGRPDWRTPLGTFSVAVKELDPVWDVPLSIQREMARKGQPVLTTVPAGPANPLGRHWLGLSVPGVGIHGTNQPTSIYRFTTHGCVRMHPDDIAALFDLVEVGTPVQIIYEPVLIARESAGTYLEVHDDVYRKADPCAEVVATILRDAGLAHLIGDRTVERMIAERSGHASLLLDGMDSRTVR
jgi:L,D-transpeptidase ErfK/SrfK